MGDAIVAEKQTDRLRDVSDDDRIDNEGGGHTAGSVAAMGLSLDAMVGRESRRVRPWGRAKSSKW
jgi:hypothetical protein